MDQKLSERANHNNFTNRPKLPLSVGIIGGGWAGLAAGVELSRAGVKVTLFEAAKTLGGRAKSIAIQKSLANVSGMLHIDNGQHILLGAYHETLKLMRALDLDASNLLKRFPLEMTYPQAGFHFRLPKLPLPLNLVVGLFGASGCSWTEKIAAVRFMQKLRASDHRLCADGNLAELLDTHHQNGRLRRFLWEPLCVAALNTPPENASAQIFVNLLKDCLSEHRADSDYLFPAVGLSELFPLAAARFIEAHGGQISCATRIKEFIPPISPTGAFDVNGHVFDHLIIAADPKHAGKLLAPHTETRAAAAFLAAYSFEPIGTAYLAYPPNFRLPRPMIGLEKGGSKGLGQWVFDRGALCDQHGLMAFVLSANGAWTDFDNESLSRTLHRELQETLGKTLPAPAWHIIIREKRATFACAPSLKRAKMHTTMDRLWLAGDHVWADYPATLEGAVRSGMAAAKAILGY